MFLISYFIFIPQLYNTVLGTYWDFVTGTDDKVRALGWARRASLRFQAVLQC